MPELLTLQDLANGHLDVKALGEAANGDENTIVTTRTGNTYPSAERAINIMFQKGGLPAKGFATKAIMVTNGAALIDGSYAMVTDEKGVNAANNGLYIKTAGVWVKSSYDPASTSADYTNSALEQYFVKSVNLFNPDATEIGFSINASGVKIPATGYAISEMITVEPSTVYTMAREPHSQNIAFISIAFYDANKTFMTRVNYDSMPTGYQQITTPAGARFAILNINAGLPSEGKRMFYKGTDELPYTKYKPVELKGVMLSSAAIDELSNNFLSANYVSSSYNLFNPSAATKGFVISNTGIIDTNPAYSFSDFIAVDAGKQYTLSHIVHSQALPFAHIAYYDINKQFIERVAVVGDAASANIVITVPSNPAVKFARFNLNAGLPSEYDRMIIKGAAAKPYKPFGKPKLQEVELGDTALQQVNDAQEINKHLLPSKNLFNPAVATIGKVISNTGAITDNTAYSISDFIAVDANSQYTISGTKGKNAFIHTSFYTADKTFISRINSFTDTIPEGYLYITTPANAAYVRFNLNDGTAYEKERMLVKGAVVAPMYQPFGQTYLTGLKLADDVVAGLDIPSGGGTGVAASGYWYSRPMNGVFNTDKVWTQYSAWNDIKSDAVYQMFDDLMALYPDYITKKVLGDDPVDGSTIAAYYFNPATQPSPVVTKRPKVFSVCGIHGMEHVSALTHYLMLKGMCEDWKTDPMLEALRFNVDWIIIPVANPWGFDRFTRKNGNGIDLNRSFPADWAYVDPDVDPGHYAGEVAGSEPETQYMMRIMDENPDLDIVLDCHSFNGDINHHHITWLHLTGKNPNDTKQHQLFQALGRRLDAKWRKDFTWFPPTTTYPLTRNTQGTTGQVQNYANLKGATYPACFEVGARWWDKAGSAPYTDYHVKSVVEVTVNWYLMLLNTLGK